MSKVAMNRRANLEGTPGLHRRVQNAIEHLYKVLAELIEVTPGTSSGSASTFTDNAVIRADGTAGDMQDSLVTIDDSGNLAMPQSTDIVFAKSGGASAENRIEVTDTASAAGSLVVEAGNAGAGNDGGDLSLNAGAATGGPGGRGGDILLAAGAAASTSRGGQTVIYGGANSSSGAGGDVFIDGGASTSGTPGDIILGAITGNVGVGTIAPLNDIHVKRTDEVAGITIETSSTVLAEKTAFLRLLTVDADWITQTPAGGDYLITNNNLSTNPFTIEELAGNNLLWLDGGGVIGVNTNNPSIHADVTLGGSGALNMVETTTPTATTGYGMLYTKTDNNLYFQDGAGNENSVVSNVDVDLTIASGTAALPTHTSPRNFTVNIEVETGTADDWDNLTGGVDGDVVIVQMETVGNVPTIKRASGGTGEFRTSDAADYALADKTSIMTLKYRDGDWWEVSRAK